jgi:hypothetical protein
MDARGSKRRDRRRGVKTAGISVLIVLAAGSVAASGPAGGRGGYGGGGGGGGGGNPTPTPTASPAATPIPVTPPPAKDSTAPSINLKLGRGQTARSILKRGLVFKVLCDEDCRHVTRLFVNRKQARELAIKRKAKRRVLVGKRTTLLKANVERTVRVKLSKKAKRGVRRMKRRRVRKLQLTIGTSATDAANNVERTTTTLSFKR